MSKSYRKPYCAITGVRSAHADKTQAARSVRRAQDHALRTALAAGIDWDEFLLPEIYECADNEVYGWSRDGGQSLKTRSKQYNNPYAYVRSPTWMSEQEIIAGWEEDKQREDDWIKYISRK